MGTAVFLQTCSYIPFCQEITGFVYEQTKTVIAGLFFSYIGFCIYDTWNIGGIQITLNGRTISTPGRAQGLDRKVKEIQRLVNQKPYLFFSDSRKETLGFLSNSAYCALRDVDQNPSILYGTVKDYLEGKEASYRQGMVLDENHEQRVTALLDKALHYKFTPNSYNGDDFRRKLLATGNSYLIFHADKVGEDSYLSDSQDGSGRNVLGIALMRIRQLCEGEGVVDRPRELDEYYKRQRA